MSLQVRELLFDYSKNGSALKLWLCLLKLARDADVQGRRKRCFGGDRINTTEIEPCCTWHCATAPTRPILIDAAT